MTIETKYYKSRDLTVFTARGVLTFENQMAVLKKFYSGKPSANMIWDFREIKGSRITSPQIRKIILYIKMHSKNRTKGKTALVADSDLDFGLARMSASYSEVEKLPWKIEAFRSMKEALGWIQR